MIGSVSYSDCSVMAKAAIMPAAVTKDIERRRLRPSYIMNNEDDLARFYSDSDIRLVTY